MTALKQGYYCFFFSYHHLHIAFNQPMVRYVLNFFLATIFFYINLVNQL